MSFPQDGKWFPQENVLRFCSRIIWLPLHNIWFPQLYKSFPKFNKSFPWVNKSFPRYIKSLPQNIKSFPLHIKLRSRDIKLCARDNWTKVFFSWCPPRGSVVLSVSLNIHFGLLTHTWPSRSWSRFVHQIHTQVSEFLDRYKMASCKLLSQTSLYCKTKAHG